MKIPVYIFDNIFHFLCEYICVYCNTTVVELSFHRRSDLLYDMHYFSFTKHYLNTLES